MTTVNTYLTFNGNCEEAFNFYRSVFGGEFKYLGRFDEMPPVEGLGAIRNTDKNKIMHISLSISNETELMGCDAIGDLSTNYKQGNNFSISINTDKMEEADRLFAQLSERGEVAMAMNKTFWGSYFGMLTDPFGINWIINMNLDSSHSH